MRSSTLFIIIVLFISSSLSMIGQVDPPCEGCGIDGCPKIQPTTKTEDPESDYNETFSDPTNNEYVYDAYYTVENGIYRGCMNIYCTVKNCDPSHGLRNISIEANPYDVIDHCEQTQMTLSFPGTAMPDQNITNGGGPYAMTLVPPIAPCSSRVVKLRVCYEFDGLDPEECFIPGGCIKFSNADGCWAFLCPKLHRVLAQSISDSPTKSSIEVQSYPNPVDRVLKLSLSQAMRIDAIRIVSLDGKRVMLNSVQSGSYQSNIELDVHDIPNGQYMFVIEGDNNVLRHSITVAH